MRAIKDASAQHGRAAMRDERLKDEVYRQMYRLEAKRPGAELGLAVALLRAWQATSSVMKGENQQEWLSKVSSIGLSLIEESLEPCCGPYTEIDSDASKP